MGDAGEHQKQHPPGLLGAPQGLRDPEVLGEVFQGEQDAEDRPALRITRQQTPAQRPA
ncbi:MAG: hypothetical protein ACREXS_12165 [Gammaproteobacteria bacterium]